MRPANLDILIGAQLRSLVPVVRAAPLASIIIMMAFLAILFTDPSQGLAQSTGKSGQENSGQKVTALPPAYTSQMLRLAEILGAVHYLRNLCGADEGMLWRDQMENIVKNEDPTPQRKAEIISRFNRGFRTYQEIHRVCGPTAVEAVNLYMRQGRRLAGEIPGRFGR